MAQVTISSDNSYNRNMLPYVMRARITFLRQGVVKGKVITDLKTRLYCEVYKNGIARACSPKMRMLSLGEPIS